MKLGKIERKDRDHKFKRREGKKERNITTLLCNARPGKQRKEEPTKDRRNERKKQKRKTKERDNSVKKRKKSTLVDQIKGKNYESYDSVGSMITINSQLII